MYVVLFNYGYEGYGLPQYASKRLEDCKAYAEKQNDTWGWRKQVVDWTFKNDIWFMENPEYTKGRKYEGWVVFEIKP